MKKTLLVKKKCPSYLPAKKSSVIVMHVHLGANQGLYPWDIKPHEAPTVVLRG